METDREVLCWFHARLVHQHGESELVDYMHRLRWIIQATKPRKTSRGQKIKEPCNDAKSLLPLLKDPSQFEKRLLSE